MSIKIVCSLADDSDMIDLALDQNFEYSDFITP